MEQNYKDTLLMPQTDFSMKANLVEKEKHFFKIWNENNLYENILNSRKDKTPFILHDGPPYANGDLHLGHALNKILKDFVIRYKTMTGFYTPYIPGWDTHGMPIENKILTLLNKTKDQISVKDLREEAKKFALEQVEKQKAQFLQMQLFSDFKKYYLTLTPDFEKRQLELFKKMVLSNLVFKSLKPVYYSPSTQSALSDAEIEYKNIESTQVFVAFPLKENDKFNNTSLIIMTTTPWTLVANSGVAIDVESKYSLLSFDNKKYIVSSDVVNQLTNKFNWTNNFKVEEEFLGKELLSLEYEHILNPKMKTKIVSGHHVNTKEGTGLVHIAPLFGEDDFLIGKENNLEMIMHLDKKCHFNQEGLKWENLFYAKANNEIINYLNENKFLVYQEKINHSYPHDWRTHKPIIYKATEQWFIDINQIKDSILEKLNKINSYPAWGITSLQKMISSRKEWVISRQRRWGVPIIIFYDEKGEPVFKEDIFDYVIDLIGKNGSNIWWEKKTDELLPGQYRNKNYTKESDIMDVWFDSGTSFLLPELENFDIDLYLEGNDQYRGWFNSSTINSVFYKNKLPYKMLISHGFVVDGKGQKMSKSIGNTIDPLAIINEDGADILRLWVATSEYTTEVVISKDVLNQVKSLYRNLRTKIRFILGNLFDFKKEDQVKDLEGLDLLMMERLNNLKLKVKEAYDEYRFINVVKEIQQFVVETSSYYFEIHKDTLYADEQNGKKRRSAQTVLSHILDFLTKALAPIIPTTCEEIYQFYNQMHAKENQFNSIFETTFDFNNLEYSSKEENKWAEFFELKNLVYKLIEDAKQNKLIKRSNEAKLILEKKYKHFENLDLKYLLMVGKIEFENENRIKTFNSIKCVRCWNHFDKIEIIEMICKRCYQVTNK